MAEIALSLYLTYFSENRWEHLTNSDCEFGRCQQTNEFTTAHPCWPRYRLLAPTLRKRPPNSLKRDISSRWLASFQRSGIIQYQGIVHVLKACMLIGPNVSCKYTTSAIMPHREKNSPRGEPLQLGEAYGPLQAWLFFKRWFDYWLQIKKHEILATHSTPSWTLGSEFSQLSLSVSCIC